MSRNFRLLEQLENEAWLATARLRPVTSSRESMRPKLGGVAYAALNKFVQNVFFNPPASSRLVVVTGAERRVGCTWLIANAAQILASETENTICVLDANWSAPGAHHMFGAANEHGFSDVLNQRRALDAVTQQVSTNLFIITAGHSRPPGPWLQHLHPLFAQLRQSFDVVLIDAAPSCPETLRIGGIADGVVLVVKAASTSHEAVRSAALELKSAGGKLLGTVLNQLEDAIPEMFFGRFCR